MALHILPQQDDFKARLGTIVGTGLGQGLNALAQGKLSDINRQRGIQQLQRIGLSPQQSELLHHIKEVNPQMYGEYLGRILENAPGVQQQQPMYNPEEYMQEQITEPSGEKISIQKEVMKPSSGSGLFEKSLSEKDKAERFKQTKEYRESILNARKSAKGDLRDLSRLEELNESGSLDSAGYVQFLQNAGLDIPALMSEDSQEFAKIQQSFLKNAKTIFGGRVSNFEVEQFLKTIPSLSMTPSGRARVIANLKLMARGSEEYYKAYEDVLRENKGIPPFDIQEQVERKMDKDKRLDRIYNQFKEDLKKPVPKGQNRIITALQSIAGSSLGGSGNVVGKAAQGLGQGIGAIGASKLASVLL